MYKIIRNTVTMRMRWKTDINFDFRSSIKVTKVLKELFSDPSFQ
jgi:hypothetical protein